MSVISITTVQQGAAIPAGVTRAGTNLSVTDASGAVQTGSVNGTETPTPWTAQFTVAPGAGSVTATDVDTTGAVIGTPVTQAYTTGTVTSSGLQTSGITVSVVTP
jgi:hypothetical protein